MTPWEELEAGKVMSYTPEEIKRMTLGAFGLANCIKLKGKKKIAAAAGRAVVELRQILHEAPINGSRPLSRVYQTFGKPYAEKSTKAFRKTTGLKGMWNRLG